MVGDEVFVEVEMEAEAEVEVEVEIEAEAKDGAEYYFSLILPLILA
jgi:hypothetical protein